MPLGVTINSQWNDHVRDEATQLRTGAEQRNAVEKRAKIN